MAPFASALALDFSDRDGQIEGRYPSSRAVVSDLRPSEPVHCLYPEVLKARAAQFLSGFPGRVLYAAKANPDPRVLRLLWGAGVRDFDTASIPEIETVKAHLPEARCHFMTPLRLPGAASVAYAHYGVRSFVVDHPDNLGPLLQELEGCGDARVFVRLAASHGEATFDLSVKFGAEPALAVALLRDVKKAGFEPALAFNVGSLVARPAAYESAFALARWVLEEAEIRPSVVDVGGGFPVAYPGVETAPLGDFFAAVAKAREILPLAEGAELYGEPGRALVAEGMSLLTQVLLRKEDAVYLNDGLYGALNEVGLSGGTICFPFRAFRLDSGAVSELTSRAKPLRVYGPTCDSMDVLPHPWNLPENLQRGDFLEFGMAGAYSLAVRTHFNGFTHGGIVEVEGHSAVPPGFQAQAGERKLSPVPTAI